MTRCAGPWVVWGVHHLVAQIGVPLRVTENILEGTYNNYASWFIVKPTDPACADPAAGSGAAKAGARGAHCRCGAKGRAAGGQAGGAA